MAVKLLVLSVLDLVLVLVFLVDAGLQRPRQLSRVLICVLQFLLAMGQILLDASSTTPHVRDALLGFSASVVPIYEVRCSSITYSLRG
jgi:hypothetical protein